MDDLLKNAKEFLESGEENIKKRRYNASVSDFFKALNNNNDFIKRLKFSLKIIMTGSFYLKSILLVFMIMFQNYLKFI